MSYHKYVEGKTWSEDGKLSNEFNWYDLEDCFAAGQQQANTQLINLTNAIARVGSPEEKKIVEEFKNAKTPFGS